MRKIVFFGCALVALSALAGQMYEWKDPATGKLMLGDKPPVGVQYWPEGQRQQAQEGKAQSDRWAEMDKKRQEKNEVSEWLSKPDSKPVAAPASDFKMFDIEAHCKQVSQAVGGSYQIEQTCRDSERRDKVLLNGMTIPPEIAAHCGEVGRAVGGSYQIMLTCVERETKAKANLR